VPVTQFSSVVSAQGVGTADVERLAQSFERLGAAIEGAGKHGEALNEHDGFGEFAEKVKEGIENPLQAIGEASEAALRAVGPLGAGLAAAAGIFGAAGTAAFEAAHALGEYATQIENTALRTGLTTKEVGQFSFAARAAGQDVSVFEAAMRKLSQGLGDTSEEGKRARQGLADLGVQAYDANGKLRPMSDIFLQISESLNRIEEPAKRNAEALLVFGRAGIELMPTIIGLSENLERAKELGLGIDEKDIHSWEQYHKQIAEAEARWEEFAARIKEPLAATFSIAVRGVTGDVSDIGAAAVQALMGQIGKTPAEDLERRFGALEAAGYVSDAQEKRFRDALQAERNRGIAAGFGAPVAVDASALSFASALAPMGDAGEMEAARNKLRDLQGQLQSQIQLKAPYSVTGPIADQIAEQKGVVAGLEARAKAAKDALDAEHALDAFEKQMFEAGSSPVERILQQMDALIARGADPARAAAAAFGGVSVEMQKQQEELEKQGEKLAARSAAEASAAWTPVYQLLGKESGEAVKGFLAEVEAGVRTGEEIARIHQETNRQDIVRTVNRQDRLQQLQLGPGHEGEAIAAGYAMRLSLAQQLYTFDMAAAEQEEDLHAKAIDQAKALADLHREMYDADLDRELKLAELEQQRLEKWRSLAVGAFNAGRTGHLGDFARQQGLGLADTVVGNFAQMGWKEISQLIPHAGAGSFLGNLLAGTPFGPDAQKVALDANTQATIANTAAMRALPMGDGGFSPSLAWGLAGLTGGPAALAALPGSGFNSSLAWGLAGLTGNPLDYGAAPTPADLANLPGGVGFNPGLAWGSVGLTGNPANYAGGGWGKDLGIGAALAAGGFGIYNGVSEGGLRGGLSAGASFAGMMGSVLPLLSKSLSEAGPIGMAVGMGLGLITALLGDPKQQRQQQLQKEAQERSFTMPSGAEYSLDASGKYTDTNFLGQSRQIQVSNTLYAMDSVSLQDFLLRNPAALSAGIAGAVQGGNAEDTVAALQQRMG